MVFIGVVLLVLLEFSFLAKHSSSAPQVKQYHDFPLLLRIWFVILGTASLAAGWLTKGPWYWRRTKTPIPPWLVRTWSTVVGFAVILFALFGHVSR
jgi:NADH:ubiquinone oxidoreductase subunit 5 (subunit L)/multisubunit Na+/H+ antiporter MnhA subunit